MAEYYAPMEKMADFTVPSNNKNNGQPNEGYLDGTLEGGIQKLTVKPISIV